MEPLFSYLSLLFLGVPCVLGKPTTDLPHDWRKLLTDDVYQYHLGNQTSAEHKFEGDILNKAYTEGPGQFLVRTQSFVRNAIVDRTRRWDEGGSLGTVPYKINDAFDLDERELILKALQDLMDKTCLEFVPHHSQTDYLHFVRRGLGCASYVGRIGGEQLIDLQPGCLNYIGEVQHEVLHALGFYHEQNRLDRDQYVIIVESNLVDGASSQFNKYVTDNLNMPYDYESIMHYGWNYFAKDNSLPTILPKDHQEPIALGSREVVSRIDVEKINRLYQCPTELRTNANSAKLRTDANSANTNQINQSHYFVCLLVSTMFIKYLF